MAGGYGEKPSSKNSSYKSTPKDKKKSLTAIWNVPDPLWELIDKVLTVYDPPATRGRKCSDPRQAFDGIIFRMRMRCQRNHLAKEFGDDSSVYRAFARWDSKGIFDILWAILLTKCNDLQGVNWQWQSADGCLGKAWRSQRRRW